MDSSDFPVSKSPRKELQGPRPAPLKLHNDSYKIKKPPVAPPPQHRHHQQQQHKQQLLLQQHHHQAPTAAPPRPPVIIYTVSPKVIHTNPNDFMTLVQRLTGSSSSSSSSSYSTASSFTSSFASASASASSSSSYDPLRDHSTGAISPAARYASIERTKQSPTTERNKKLQIHNEDHHSFIMGGAAAAGGINSGFVEGIEMDHNIERSCLFPGILSPGPTSLPMISPTFFSPPSSDPNTFSFLHDLSPVVHGNKNFIEGSFMPSPSAFISPYLTSPTPSIDLFNSFFFDF